MDKDQIAAMKILKRYKNGLTKQQLLTIRGQIFAKDIEGAMKGLDRCLKWTTK